MLKIALDQRCAPCPTRGWAALVTAARTRGARAAVPCVAPTGGPAKPIRPSNRGAPFCGAALAADASAGCGALLGDQPNIAAAGFSIAAVATNTGADLLFSCAKRKLETQRPSALRAS